MINKIEIQNLTHRYDESRALFDNLNAVLPTNEIVFFDGGIGSGRSTLLKMMTGLLIPQSGGVLFNDQLISDLSFEEFLPIRLKIGYSFEYAGLLHNRTIRENLILPLLYHSLCDVKEANRRIDELCEVFGLVQAANLRPSAVSGSQRKACIVARAFAMDPEVVLLDEPFSGLSASMITQVKTYISDRMNKSNLHHVFLTSQNHREIENWASRKILVEPTQLTGTALTVAPNVSSKEAA